MPELTLEALAARVAAVERRLDTLSGVVPPSRDWRSVVGLFDGSEFMPRVYAEIQSLRAAEDTEVRNEGQP